MKKIFSSADITLVSLYQAMLETNGIKTHIKNYFLSGGVGDIPANAVLPELWVIDDEQFDAAKAILTNKGETSWQCHHCGEKLSGQFAQCWKCGSLRDA